VIRTSTHIMHLLYHTVQTHVIQLLLLTISNGQDVYTRHAFTISHCSDTRHSITISYYILVIRTSTHIMHLLYHTVQTHVIQLFLLTISSGQDVYTRHAFTTSHCSDTRHSITHSYYIQWSGRLHTSCIYNITLFRQMSCNH